MVIGNLSNSFNNSSAWSISRTTYPDPRLYSMVWFQDPAQDGISCTKKYAKIAN